MVDKKKYVFISSMSAPYQVKFCYALQEYFDAEFWFYVKREANRPIWWQIDLKDKCKIMSDSFKIKKIKKIPDFGYVSIKMIIDLIKFKPDIVVFHGFMAWHVFGVIVAHMLKAKVAVMTEPARYALVTEEQTGETLLTKENAKKTLKLVHFLFNKVDLYIGMGLSAKKQLIEEFQFEENKVISLPYPQDIEGYYNHPIRIKKPNDKFTLLFANRLVERYHPLMALAIYKVIKENYPSVTLHMNNEGSLRSACVNYITDNNLKDVTFLDQIASWDDMHLCYKMADILILPCGYSNGNGSIIEAKASGMGLVISDRINNIQRHSIDNVNCFICELSVDAFVQAIRKYLDNPQLLVEHGISGRKMVEYKRNDNMAKLYYDVFSQHGFID
ncbi:MAG: glycosyltransferase [Erysipelotrichaceae bacterium]|nr:glycosyltransferase [Erysipelotrichaceae bacterium]